MATIIEAAWMLHLRGETVSRPSYPWVSPLSPLHQEKAKREPGLQQPHQKYYNHRRGNNYLLHHQLNFLWYTSIHVSYLLLCKEFTKQPPTVSGGWSVCWTFLAHYGTCYWCTFRACSHMACLVPLKQTLDRSLRVWFTNEVSDTEYEKPLQYRTFIL